MGDTATQKKTEPEMDLPSIQRRDEDLAAIIEYFETGILPDEKVAPLVLSKSQYVLGDYVLCKVEQDSTLHPGINGNGFSKMPMEECLGHT